MTVRALQMNLLDDGGGQQRSRSEPETGRSAAQVSNVYHARIKRAPVHHEQMQISAVAAALVRVATRWTNHFVGQSEVSHALNDFQARRSRGSFMNKHRNRLLRRRGALWIDRGQIITDISERCRRLTSPVLCNQWLVSDKAQGAHSSSFFNQRRVVALRDHTCVILNTPADNLLPVQVHSDKSKSLTVCKEMIKLLLSCPPFIA